MNQFTLPNAKYGLDAPSTPLDLSQFRPGALNGQADLF